MMGNEDFEDALRQEVRQMASEARDQLDGHPSPKTLLAYETEELSEQEAAKVRSHLVVCRECARAVLDLAAFPDIEPAPGVEPLSAEQEEAQWGRLLDRIAREEDRAAPGSGSLAGWRTLQLLAAGLALLCLALGFWVYRLEQRPGTGEGPTANLYVTELLPVDTPVLRGVQRVRVPPGMRSVVLLLIVSDLRPFDDYRVRVRRGGEGGEVAWEQIGLVRGSEGYFTISVPRGLLPTGRYRLVLEGLRPGETERLAEYDLRIEYEE